LSRKASPSEQLAVSVALALLPSGAPLGFVAILGVLALIGILIRNSD
jgi:multidrug efflux pump subunit AcrB